MWRNTVVEEFVEWLSNDGRAGFYGMDLYSLHRSRESVVRYLQRVDPDAASRASYRYSCFDHFGEDTQEYGYAASFDLSRACEQQVLEQLMELQRRAGEPTSRHGQGSEDDLFSAEQNARLVKNAEHYYRSMFEPRSRSWNVRDQHMADTLDALDAHLSRTGSPARIVVWAHNSHLGDSRATEMRERGEWNVGQLMRERHPGETFLIGFSTYEGSVTAAHNWDKPSQTMDVRPGMDGSYERLFHDIGTDRFVVYPNDDPKLAQALRRPLLQRAIGVIYRPRTERVSHYFEARLADQFDAMIHIDRTTALRELAPHMPQIDQGVPETFPAGV
jgi:erythromycin esterase-like protein